MARRPRRINHEKPNKYRDPFEAVGQAPKGRVYQWVAESILGRADLVASDLARMKAGGWKPVPAKRHPKLPHRGNQIVMNGQVLMERSKKIDGIARALELTKARVLQRQVHEKFGIESAREGSIGPVGIGALGSPILAQEPSARSVEEVKQTLAWTNGVFHVDVTLAVLISDREIDTAINVLGIEPQEYVRRRIIMDTSALVRVEDGEAVISPNHVSWSKPIFTRAAIYALPAKE